MRRRDRGGGRNEGGGLRVERDGGKEKRRGEGGAYGRKVIRRGILDFVESRRRGSFKVKKIV